MTTATTSSTTSSGTPSEKFFRYFQHEVTALEDEVGRLEDHGASGGELADAVEHCLAGIARLSNEVKDSSSFLPAYDQRTYSEAIKALSNKLQAVRTQLAPRQKFSFKKSTFSVQKNESAISLGDAAELANRRRNVAPGGLDNASADSSFTTTPAGLRSPEPESELEPKHNVGQEPDGIHAASEPHVDAQRGVVSFSHRHDQAFALPTSAQSASSAIVTNVSRCVIDLSSPIAPATSLATLTLRNISDSLILAPHLVGPAHLTNITNSVIVLSCRQFRMHESEHCSVYLYSRSRPIIEDCSDVCFAPLPETFLTGQEQSSENKWDQVDDFKWLRAEPSPNWLVLDQDRRISESVWKKLDLKGNHDLNMQETLAAVGLRV